MQLALVIMKTEGIALSHNKMNLDPSESLFFHTKAAGVHRKRSSSGGGGAETIA